MAGINSYFLAISVLIITFTTSGKNVTSEENSNHLKDIFKEPKPGTDGITFIKSTPANLQSQVQPLLSSGLKKLHLTLQLQGSKNRVDFNFLWNLNKLEYLWITSSKGTRRHVPFIKFSPRNGSYLSITNLHYNVKVPMLWHHEFGILIQSIKSLQVLDVSGTYLVRVMSLYSLVDSLNSAANVSSLKAMSIQRTYHEQGLINNNFKLNFTRLLRPLQHSPLEYLDISHNGLYILEGNFLEFTPKLKILDISYNNLVYGGNRIQFASLLVLHPTIEIINVERQNSGLGDVLPQPSKNEIVSRTIRTKRSHISDASAIAHCFRYLNVTLNNVNHMQICEIVRCFGKIRHDNYNIIPCSFIPDLQQLTSWLEPHSNCAFGIKIPVSPKLKYVNLSGWGPTFSFGNADIPKTATFCFQKNSAESINFSKNPSFFLLFSNNTIMDLSIVGMEHLKKLELQQNQQQFIFTNTKFLQSFPNLKYLNLGGNMVKFVNVTTLNDTFGFIEFLDLSSNGLSDVNFPATFIVSSIYLKYLNLMGNNFERFHLLFNNTPNLTMVNLSDNKIRYVMADTLTSLNQHRTTQLELNLKNNLLYCGCDTQAIATIDFIIRSPQSYNLRFESSSSYQCNDGIKTVQIYEVDLNTLRSTCFPSHLQLILSIISANTAFLALVFTLIMLYKYRYHLRTSYFRINLRLRRPQAQTRFRYDAFVSYCADDRFWVHGSLMKELEDKYGYRLCIHYRDFMPGADIAEAILEAIDQSRSVIFILSNIALKSGWCEFELKVAHGRSIRENRRLIVIKLENIEIRENTSNLVRELLDGRVYIKWPDVKDSEQDARLMNKIKQKQDLFWARLGNTLCDRPAGYTGCLNCLHNMNHDAVAAIADEDTDINPGEDVPLL